MTRVQRLRRVEIQDQRIEDYRRLAQQIARKAFRRLPKHPYEDILSAAYLGLTKAARGFKPSKRVPFDYYARTRISGEIIDAHRKLHKTQYVNEFPPEPIDATDWFAGTEAMLQAKALAPVIRELTKTEQKIVALRYQENLTLAVIGVRIKLSECRVSQLHKRALLKMRENMGRSGITREELAS